MLCDLFLCLIFIMSSRSYHFSQDGDAQRQTPVFLFTQLGEIGSGTGCDSHLRSQQPHMRYSKSQTIRNFLHLGQWTVQSQRSSPKAIAKNRAYTRAFYIISAQVTPKIASVAVTQSVSAAVAPTRVRYGCAPRSPLVARRGQAARTQDSPLAVIATADTANSMHNINLHNVNFLVHILLKFDPLNRATSHLHSHSRTRSADLRT